ncbi:unnamed protein product [Mycetohabitans rhizoxinica HKI 454]|uniref:Uncharacterized protein n=1 Tax=Mycetohabitans rhizoxinica (strain DSM 19002 / CIP 109453 / HKI 454) TaxID=882378 RepID=E5AN17_MYCRK|nr:unnamed protein product [Mycetohabitans rhizoxinica HKI 454]
MAHDWKDRLERVIGYIVTGRPIRRFCYYSIELWHST